MSHESNFFGGVQFWLGIYTFPSCEKNKLKPQFCQCACQIYAGVLWMVCDVIKGEAPTCVRKVLVFFWGPVVLCFLWTIRVMYLAMTVRATVIVSGCEEKDMLDYFHVTVGCEAGRAVIEFLPKERKTSVVWNSGVHVGVIIQVQSWAIEQIRSGVEMRPRNFWMLLRPYSSWEE